MPGRVPPCRAAPAPRPPPPATRMPAPLSGESRDTAHPVPGAARGVPRVGRGRRRGMRGAAGPFSARVPAGRGRAAPGGPGWARAGSGSPSVRPCFPSASSESGLAVGRAPSGRAPNVTAAPGPRGGAAAPAPRLSRRGGSDVSGGEEKPKRFPPPEKRGQSRPRARSGAEFPPEPRPRRAHARRPQPPEQVQPIAVGQVQVQDHQLGRMGGQGLLRLPEGVALGELPPRLVQGQADALAQGPVVLHNQNMVHRTCLASNQMSVLYHGGGKRKRPCQRGPPGVR